MADLAGALAGTTEAEKRLLYLRFVKEVTQDEIADELE